MVLWFCCFCGRLPALAHGADEFAVVELDVEVFFGLGLLGVGDDVATGVVDDGVAACEGGEWAQGVEGAGEVVEALLRAFEVAGDAVVEALAQFVCALLLLLEAAFGLLEVEAAVEGVEGLLALLVDVVQALVEGVVLLDEVGEEGCLRGAGEFGGGGGGGGAQVGGEVC